MRNEFDVIGHVVRLPRLSRTPRGTDVATYIVGCRDDFDRSRSHYFVIHSFGRQAINDHKYLRAQNLVGARGRIKQWFNPERKMGGFFFEAERVVYLDSGRGGSRAAEPAAGAVDEEVLQFLAEMDSFAPQD